MSDSVWHRWLYASVVWEGNPATEASSSALRPLWLVFHAQASLVEIWIEI